MAHNHQRSNSNLKVAFFLNLGFTILEIIVGFYVNSVAILSDAVHDFGDSLSLGLSWVLEKKAQQKPDKKYSFGYARFSLLGALINSVVIVGSSGFIIYEAIERIIAPETSNAQGMFLFALVGISVNGYAAWRLSTGKTMNERVISWHLIEDVLGWVAILIASIILMIKDVPYLDPILSLFITFYILWNVLKRLKETIFLFLQGTPTDINADEIESALMAITHVENVHHTHIWSLEGEQHVFTTHIKLKPLTDLNELLKVKNDVKAIMNSYSFKHYTIETELDHENCGEEGVEHSL